jgi:hypothetical protein
MQNRTRAREFGKNVIDFNGIFQQNKAHPERLETIRQWHQDQAANEDGFVAALHISITASGIIKSQALCIEPEHAAILRGELLSTIKRLDSIQNPL